MANKTVQVSLDDTTYYTLPGNTGEASNEAATLDDTIFGSGDYKSSQTGLIQWTLQAQAFYKGFAGYVAKILSAGDTTALTDEATTQVGSSQTYRVTSASKRILDPAVAIIVQDHSGTGSTVADVTDQVESINYLFGEITFKDSYTPTGAVLVHSGSYFPTAAFGKANSFTLTQTAEAVENTDFNTAQENDGFRTYEQGLRTVQLELNGFYDVANGLKDLLQGRSTIIVEINPDGNGKSLARGFFKVSSQSQQGNVGAIEEEKATLMLQVPSSDYLPFGWHHESDTTLHTSIQNCLNSWLDDGEIFVKYLHDGTNGIKGATVITEITLQGGVDNMNEFSAKFQGTDATTTIGTG